MICLLLFRNPNYTCFHTVVIFFLVICSKTDQIWSKTETCVFMVSKNYDRWDLDKNCLFKQQTHTFENTQFTHSQEQYAIFCLCSFVILFLLPIIATLQMSTMMAGTQPFEAHAAASRIAPCRCHAQRICRKLIVAKRIDDPIFEGLLVSLFWMMCFCTLTLVQECKEP